MDKIRSLLQEILCALFKNKYVNSYNVSKTAELITHMISVIKY